MATNCELQTATKRALPGAADVISIQSQVISGCVGNSIALPSLTRHGWKALAVPTWLLSNTPDADGCYGGEIPDAWFSGFLRSLHERGLDRQLRAVVIGYLGSTTKATVVTDWLNQTLRTISHAHVIVDPVLGDADTGFYVDPSLTGWYRDYILPMATGMTPNLFELSALSGKSLNNRDDVIFAARTFLSEKMQWVAVTSASGIDKSGKMEVICVSKKTTHIIEHDAYAGAPKGTGDLFTAEITAGLLRGLTPEQAAEQASESTRRCVLDSLISGTGILNPRILSPGEQAT